VQVRIHQRAACYRYESATCGGRKWLLTVLQLIWNCCGDFQRRTYWGMLGENFHFVLFEHYYASFEIFTVVWLRVRSFWHMTLHFCLCCHHSAHFDWIKLFSHVNLRHFLCCEGALYIHLQGFWEQPLKRKANCSLECWEPLAQYHISEEQHCQYQLVDGFEHQLFNDLLYIHIFLYLMYTCWSSLLYLELTSYIMHSSFDFASSLFQDLWLLSSH